MIIDRVEMKDMAATDDIPVLDLSKLDIAPEHHAAIEKAVKELERQGLSILSVGRLSGISQLIFFLKKGCPHIIRCGNTV